MSPKEIADKILNCETYDIPDIQELASAYLELEKELTFRKDAEIPVYKEEITKLEEENEKLSEQVFKDVEYINYTQEQLESAKSVLLQKTLDIDSLTAENENLREALAQETFESEKLKDKVERRRKYIKELKACIDMLTPKARPVYLNNLSASIHQTNVEAGWWTNLETGEPLERNVGELLCLVHSEVSEALEAYRKDLNDDKLPHRKGFEVELVDALIRIFDIAGKFKLDLDGALEDKLEYNAKRSDHKPENRLGTGGKKF